MKRKTMVAVILSALCWIGPAALAQELDPASSPEKPYTSLGTLEVREKAGTLFFNRLGWTLAEAATLTRADTPSRADVLRSRARERLLRKARKNYGAHDVVSIEYWPAPESEYFPDGFLLARGEMIRYTPFPAEDSQS
jgi:hypothetical protein